MGEARRRGSFEDRKAEAIKTGRDPEVRRKKLRIYQAAITAEYLAFTRNMMREEKV